MKYPIYFGDKHVRFALGTNGTSPLFVFGVNPSAANASKSDQTIRKVEGFLKAWRDMKLETKFRGGVFDSFIMLNLYPARGSDPRILPSQPARQIEQLNLEIINYLLGVIPNPTVWAAWGDAIDLHPYLLNCLIAIKSGIKNDVQWKKLGPFLTQKNLNPKHPNPHKHDFREVLTDFDIDAYVKGKLPR